LNVFVIPQCRPADPPQSHAGGADVLPLFVAVSFFAREQPANTYVLQKADRLVRTAGSPTPAN
jgi:hypothetical protein